MTIVQKAVQILGVLKCPLEVDLSLLTKATFQEKKLGTHLSEATKTGWIYIKYLRSTRITTELKKSIKFTIPSLEPT